MPFNLQLAPICRKRSGSITPKDDSELISSISGIKEVAVPPLPKHFHAPRFRRAPPERGTASKWDRRFLRASQSAQVVAVILAIFGYFYTVRPVYQKALLDEQIAERTLELNAKNAESAKKDHEIEARQRDLAQATSMLQEANTSLAKSQKLMNELRSEKEALYVELRPALAMQFRLQGLDCTMGAEDSADYPPVEVVACLKKRAVTTYHMDYLSGADRKELDQLISAAAPYIISEIKAAHHMSDRDAASKAIFSVVDNSLEAIFDALINRHELRLPEKRARLQKNLDPR